MKKKTLSLSKKLFLQRGIVATLNQQGQHQVVGGAPAKTYGCHTWLPNAGCYTETNQFILCL
ncbi:class I lanthipeptide [Chitinophaga qingshengii]|uniref:Class I lanthipeptide n=1 Tax=Chitinophaga qingshengii TaxID=1569794 RepID=A0ABR7TY64_9BACT|nr:class I lanthipeptide [Chitinophaga qingshengii]MBC9934436.1 class I lanthipeptide [Chitinophaga qingshengii]